MEDVQKAAEKLNKSLPTTEKATRKTGKAAESASSGVKKLENSIGGLITKLAALAAAAIAVKESLSASFERSNLEQRIKNNTDSIAEYQYALDLATVSQDRFGFSRNQALSGVGESVATLGALGYELNQINDIFTGFNVIARESGISSEDAAEAFNQLQQAMAKGTLAGEDLRTKLARMPQIAELLANKLGASAKNIRQLGADGKLTGSLIAEVLSDAAKRADSVKNGLTENQQAISNLEGAVENAQVAFGELLGPYVIQGMNALADAAVVLKGAFDAMKIFIDKNKQAITSFLQVAFELAKIATIVYTIVKAFTAMQKAIELVKAAKAGLLTLTGVGLAKVAAAAGVTALAYAGVNKAFEGINESLDAAMKAAQEELDAAKLRLDTAEQTQDVIQETVKDEKELAKAAKQVTQRMSEAAAAADRRANAQGSIADLENELAQQKITTEKALNQVLLDQAQTRLENAQTDQQRIRAATDIYNLTIAQAALDKEAAKAQVAAAVEKSRVAVENLQLKLRELQAVVALAEAEGTANEEHYKALKLQQEAVSLAEQQYGLRQQIAVEQNKEINALFKAQQNAAKLAYEQNIVADNTQRAANAAGDFASNMASAAQSASQAAAASTSLGGVGTTSTGSAASATGTNYVIGGPAAQDPYFQKMRQDAIDQFRERKFVSGRIANDAWNELQADLFRKASKYNKRVREGQMDEARDNYRNIMRGGGSGSSAGNNSANSSSALLGGTPTVNVTTGPVLNMDNQNYVTQEDFIAGLQTAAREGAQTALTAIRSGGGSRRELGVG